MTEENIKYYVYVSPYSGLIIRKVDVNNKEAMRKENNITEDELLKICNTLEAAERLRDKIELSYRRMLAVEVTGI